MNKIAIYLNKNISGVVYSAPSILDSFSTDRSMLRYRPRLVAEPINASDVRRLLRFSYQLAQKKISLPITVRGAGYSKNGSSIGSGMIISMARMNKIQELDTRQRLVRVQAGVTIGELRKALNLHGLDLPIYGNERETIGGLIAKNASVSVNTDPKNIADFIECAEVILADGSKVQLEQKSRSELAKKQKEDTLEADIYHQINELYQSNKKTIEELAHDDNNRAGYAGIREICEKKGINLIPLLCGSEGTLGVITEVILRCEPVFDAPNYVAVVCNNAESYVKNVEILKKIGCTDMLVYDTEMYNAAEQTGKTSNFFRKASDDGYFIVATIKDDQGRVRRRKLKKVQEKFPATTRVIVSNKDNRRDFAILEQNLFAYLNDSGSDYRLPILDGAYIPPENQAKYLNAVTAMSKQLNLQLAVYGSPEFNTFTVRPNFNPSNEAGRKKLIAFIKVYLDVIKDCQGYPCGEAAEGRFLAIFTKRLEKPEVLRLNASIKQIFDPFDILNPGLKQEVDMAATLRHFRTDYNPGIIPRE